MPTEKNQQLLNRYLAGEMSKEEERSFENLISQNADLRAELDRQQKVLDKSIEEGALEYARMKKKLDQFHAEVISESSSFQETVAQEIVSTPPPTNQKITPTPVRKLSPFKWVGAIAAALFVGLFAWYLMKPQLVSNEQLYAQYGETPEISFTQMGTSSNDLIKAEELFNQKKYKDALVVFDVHLEKEPNDFQVILYKGIAHMNQGEPAKARSAFKKVANSDTLFKTEGDWYQILHLLKQGKTKLCRKALKSFLQKDSNRKKEAQKLLDQLEVNKESK